MFLLGAGKRYKIKEYAVKEITGYSYFQKMITARVHSNTVEEIQKTASTDQLLNTHSYLGCSFNLLLDQYLSLTASRQCSCVFLQSFKLPSLESKRLLRKLAVILRHVV